MKKIFLLFIFFAVLGGLLYFNYLNNQNRNKINVAVSATPTSVVTSISKTSIFVPYWTDFSNNLALDNYDRAIYFGIDAGENGINTNNTSYKNIGGFINSVNGNKEKYLTIKMLNTEANINIIKNRAFWPKIINETIDIAKNYGFDGLVLDLEISTIPVVDLTDYINQFVEYFYSQTKGQLRLALTIYGDNYYRKRPYDLETLSNNSDEIMIMAYDFHKSSGEPGPNFPLAGEKYGYDFQKMVKDFTAFAPKNKLSVIFGMYGYDWLVDEKKRPVKSGEALTLNQIKKKFISNCQWKNCVVRRDDISKETEVDYVISQVKDNFATMYPHIVWFEDEESVRLKTIYLQKQGIGSVAYWAYGYF